MLYFLPPRHEISQLSFLAVVLQKAERKWEEKRQNLDHYNGKEFEKLLEEAQANIMKSIPNLEMPPASGPQPKGDAPADKLEPSGQAPPELGGLLTLGSVWCHPHRHMLAGGADLPLPKPVSTKTKKFIGKTSPRSPLEPRY